ncbi:MAG: asparaginase [Oscillospiraceae bacterium]
MKKVLMITTGGTIASRRTKAGLEPVLDSAQLLGFVPDARRICEVETLSLMNKDSTEMLPFDWLVMAKCIEENYERYDGFVLCHGTDTMAFTSAMLSYLIQNSKKPIIVTGSQKPIDMEITDARQNLLDSFLYASSNKASGVQIVFDGTVIAGTRAKKTHTKSYNAFSTTNYPPLAVIKSGKIVQYIDRTENKDVCFYKALDENVELLKLVPGSSPDVLRFLLSQNDGIVVESFGTGGVPNNFFDAIEKGVKKNKTVVMTTQVPNEGSDMAVYKVGKGIKESLGLLEAYDMTLEAVVTKLMWVLGQSHEHDEVKRLLYTTINCDILMNE